MPTCLCEARLSLQSTEKPPRRGKRSWRIVRASPNPLTTEANSRRGTRRECVARKNCPFSLFFKQSVGIGPDQPRVCGVIRPQSIINADQVCYFVGFNIVRYTVKIYCLRRKTAIRVLGNNLAKVLSSRWPIRQIKLRLPHAQKERWNQFFRWEKAKGTVLLNSLVI